MRTMVLCLLMTATAVPHAQSDGRRPAGANAPQAPANPEGDRNQRDAIEWAQVLGLRDEFVVQALLRDGLDPSRANQVRAVLLELAMERERVRAAFVAKADASTAPERQSALDEVSKAGADSRKTVERRLKGILSDSEVRRFWDSMEDAHFLAVLYISRRTDQAARVTPPPVHSRGVEP